MNLATGESGGPRAEGPGAGGGGPAGAAASLSIVVPVYRGAATLPELVARLAAVLAAHPAPWEILLVDDGSPDESWRTIGELAAAEPRVGGLRLMRNYGQHNALLAGLRAARHEVVVTLDDDLQNPPEEIPLLLAALAPEVDVVYGSPVEERHGLWRDLASRLTKQVLQAGMGAETARKVSAFRAFRTELRAAFAGFSGPFVSLDVLLTWATSRFVAVPVRCDPRRHGRSNYTARRLVVHALNLVTGFSVAPLRLASAVGLLFAAFGMAVLAFVVVGYLVRGGSVPGFPFLASIIALFSGAQLLALGILGEYLARIHFRTLDRPAYAVRQRVGAAGGEDAA